MINNYEIGEQVLVLCAWVDPDCWVQGTVVKVTDKRIKVDNAVRGVGYYKPENVKKVSS